MNNNGIVYVIYLALCGIMAVYFVSTGGTKSQAASGSDADELALLFGGGLGGHGGAGDAHAAPSQNNGSLFDSGFWNVGAPEGDFEDMEIPGGRTTEDGEEPAILEPANPNNPVNPMTGQPYPNRVMKVFDKLREKFPNNSMIPQQKTPEQKLAEDHERREVFELQSLIAQGKAEEAQVNRFYDFQTKQYHDRKELVEYVLAEKADAMSPEIKQQYEKILDMTNRQLNAFEQQKTQALQRIGAR